MIGAWPRRPFSNGTEWDAWSAGWCYQCADEPDCPLLEIVFIDEATPREWHAGDEGALGPARYVCTVYRAK
jgi:hypothetical protein